MVSLGNAIGAGIFTLTGLGAKYAGPSVSVSFIVGGILNIMTAFVYSEYSSKLPYSGAGYVYAYTTFGEFPAWMVGWNLN